MQDLYENGVKVQAERLSEVVPIGFVLCFLCKPLIPNKRVADMDVTLTAVQAWKGRRISLAKMETGSKNKIRLPAPGEATHLGRSGKVVLLEDALGLAQLESRADGGGQKVLFVKQRHFNQNGQLAQLPLADTLSLGDSLNFDMIKAGKSQD